MPVSGNPYRVIRRALEKTAKEKLEVQRAAAGAVKELLADQFGFGVDPDGKPQPAAKGKFSGLMSKKLPRAIKVTPDVDGVTGVGELKSSGMSSRRRAKGRTQSKPRQRRQWLMAHQIGHTFPARHVEGQRRFFDNRGKRVHATRFKAITEKATKRVTTAAREAYWQERKNSARLVGRVLNVRSHSIRQRVLPVRRIYPVGTLGRRWGGRIKTAVAVARQKQLQRNVEHG